MRIGSLFSGIGGLELGLEWSGLGHTVWQVEMDSYCREILAKHWPDAERFKDVHYVGKHNLAPVSMLIGGFPCQDLSGAGAGAGLTGERSGLWFEFARIIEEIEPEWVVIENVASGADRWVDTVRKHLARIGYDSLPVPLSAQDVGAPHIRRRVFVIAHAVSYPLRDWAEWESWRPSDGVRAEGEAEPQHDGVQGDAAYTDGVQRDEEHAEPGGLQEETRSKQEHRASRASAPGTPARDGRRVGRNIEPSVRGVDDGFRGWLDGPTISPTVHVGEPRRIRALGNAVVPQCAEVIGWMIREMCGSEEQ